MLLTTPIVQSEIAKYATSKLKDEYNLDVNINRVAIGIDGNVLINNLHVNDHHNNTLININILITSISDFNKLLNGDSFDFGSSKLSGVEFNIRTYKEEDISNLDRVVNIFDDGSPSSGKFRMSFNDVTLEDGDFSIHDDNDEDSLVLEFKELNGKVNDFRFVGPNIYGDVIKLSMKTHWGISVDDLHGYYTMTRKGMSLTNMELNTPESHLKGNIYMQYPLGGLAKFTRKVKMTVDFDKSKLATNDLKKFYNEFAENQIIYLDAIAQGTLNTFKVYNAQLETSNNVKFSGNLSFENLFDKEKEFRFFGGFNHFQASRNEAIGLLPNLMKNSLPTLLNDFGEIYSSGNIVYTNSSVTANVNVVSDLGSVSTDFYMDKLNNPDLATYKGLVVANNFNIGKLFNSSDLKNISTNLVINGKGFTQESLQTIVKGNIQKFDFSGYTYSDINLDGEFKVPYYKGKITSNDPNAKLFFDGLIDLSQKKTNYDFSSTIEYLNLEKLNLVTGLPGIFKGKVNLIGQGDKLDEFVGVVSIDDLAYFNNDSEYNFQNFIIESQIKEDNVKFISINSPDIIEGYIEGKFKFKEIQSIVENALGSLYTNYKPNKLEKNQYVDFNLNIHNQIIEILSPNTQLSDNTNVIGKINADNGVFKLDVNSPFVKQNNNILHNISVKVDNSNPLFNTYITMDSIKALGYKISDFNLINVTENDTLFVRTEFVGGEQKKDQFNLNLYHTINEDNKSIIAFQKSEVKVKDFFWYINEKDEDKNRIVFNKKIDDITIEPIQISHEGQSLQVEGRLNGNKYKDLKLDFKDVELSKITPDIKGVELEGKIQGIVSFIQENEIFKPNSNLTISDLKFNKVALGNMDFKVSGDENLRRFKVDASLVDDFTETLSLRGNIDVDKANSKLNLDAIFKKFKLDVISPFLDSVFKDFKGDASGRVTILGSYTNPEINGRVHLFNTKMNSVFTGVNYEIEENTPLDITQNSFLFKGATIQDVKSKTKASLNGKITHNKLEKWALDINLNSDNFLVLDTQYTEGLPYYGKAFIDGKAHLFGPIDGLELNVEATSKPNTVINIPLYDKGGLGDNNYVRFVTKEEKEKKAFNSSLAKVQGLQMNFEFFITPDAEINVLLDQSGHGMKGKGGGFLTMEINTLGRFNMWGDYTVYNGEYNFKYENIIDKKLEVKKFGTIRWDGQPMNANLDLEAVYKTQANPGVILESSVVNRKIDTDVSILLNGSLATPEIDFKINFPNVSNVIKSELEYKLSDKDNRETQAMALLATGSFLTAENASTAVYGSLFERASSLFEDLFADEDGKFKVGFNYSQRDRNPYAEQEAARVGLTLSTQITDKVLINGKLGVPIGGTEDNVIVGDVEVQLLLNDEGNLKARVFNRENNINYLGEGIGYKQGVGLTYEVDFDTFKELLTKIFKQADRDKKNKKESYQYEDLQGILNTQDRKKQNEK